MKKTKLLCAYLFLSSIALTGCKKEKPESRLPIDTTIYPTKIEADEPSTVILVGRTFQIVWEVLPSNAEDKSVIFYSEKPEIASVTSDGLVQGVSAGRTNIVIESVAKSSVQKKLTVKIDKAGQPIVG